MGALERVLRAQGKEAQANKTQKQLLSHIRKQPNTFSPTTLRTLLLWEGETNTPTLEALKGPIETADRESLLGGTPSGKAHDACVKCGDRGITKKLKAYSVCNLVKYCSRECQKTDWKESHKKHCRDMLARQNEREASAMLPGRARSPRHGGRLYKLGQSDATMLHGGRLFGFRRLRRPARENSDPYPSSRHRLGTSRKGSRRPLYCPKCRPPYERRDGFHQPVYSARAGRSRWKGAEARPGRGGQAAGRRERLRPSGGSCEVGWDDGGGGHPVAIRRNSPLGAHGNEGEARRGVS